MQIQHHAPLRQSFKQPVRQMLKFLKRLGLISALYCTTLVSAQAFDLNVTDFKLANGMEVVVIPDHRAPVVTHMVWYKVGAADEVSGKSGLAHFFEHLMFKGTSNYPQGEFDRLVSSNGGEQNAFTTSDYTAYFQRIAKDRLELMMQLEADRMQNLVLTDEVVKPELLVVQEERRQRTENNPSALLSEQMDAALYTAHPYGRPIVGWMSEVAKLSKDDAIAFYKSHYTPANAILVVAGDVEPEEVKKIAEKYYGSLKNTFEPQARERTAEPEPLVMRQLTMVDKRVSQPSFQRSYLAPSYTTAPGNEAYALDLLSDILGSGSQSRLYKKLVVDEKIAAYAGSWYAGTALDAGSFGVYASPAPNQSSDKISNDVKVAAAIEQVIADVVKNGVTQAELDRVRNKKLADMVYLLDDQVAMANMFGAALSTGRSVKDILNTDEALKSVTLEDIKKAAEKTLVARRSVTGLLLPEPASNN